MQRNAEKTDPLDTKCSMQWNSLFSILKTIVSRYLRKSISERSAPFHKAVPRQIQPAFFSLLSSVLQYATRNTSHFGQRVRNSSHVR